MIDTILAFSIVVMRLMCLVSYGALFINSAYRLINMDSDSQTKNVYIFILLLTGGIAFASCLSVYSWILALLSPQVSNPGPQVLSFLVTVMFTVPGVFGVFIFKPWEIK